MLHRLLLFALALSLAACAALGLQAPQTFEQRIAAGYLTVNTVADGATAALTGGQISKADALNVVAGTRVAVQGLDIAQTAFGTACPPPVDPKCTAPAADAKLQATLAALAALQAYLVAQQAAHPGVK